jgi:four helix bundle protein
MSKIEDSAVWRRAMDLTKSVYQLTKQLPSDERFGLVQQMRRAAVSIPSNVAEGYGRRSPREFEQFVGIAKGSLLEVRTLLLLCVELGYVKHANEQLELSEQCTRLLSATRKSLATR